MSRRSGKPLPRSSLLTPSRVTRRSTKTFGHPPSDTDRWTRRAQRPTRDWTSLSRGLPRLDRPVRAADRRCGRFHGKSARSRARQREATKAALSPAGGRLTPSPTGRGRRPCFWLKKLRLTGRARVTRRPPTPLSPLPPLPTRALRRGCGIPSVRLYATKGFLGGVYNAAERCAVGGGDRPAGLIVRGQIVAGT